MSGSTHRKNELILVVGPTWIGDMIIALPALQALRRRCPACRLAVLTKPHLRPLWVRTGLADRLVDLEPGSIGTLRTASNLRGIGFHRVYIIPNSFRSALLAMLAGIETRIGFAGHWRSWMLTDVVAPEISGRRHQVYEMLKLVGADPDSGFEGPRLDIDPSELSAVRQRYGMTGREVGLIPGAARGPSKCWPEMYYARLGEMLADAGRSVVIFGSPSERGLCERIAARVGESAASLAGRTSVAEWAALLASCAVVVANDSGGMHLAAALDRPLVAIFGITDPDKTGPLGERCRVIQQSELRSRDVPRDSVLARKCLESITPESVYSHVQELLDLNL